MNPQSHFTLHEDGNVSVIHHDQPLCAPTTFESARKVAIQFKLGGLLPVWDAQLGKFGAEWPRPDLLAS